MKRKLDAKNLIIGYRMKQLRLARGYTQITVAEELNMTPQHYGTLERGLNSFTLDNIIKLCNWYNVPVISILKDLENDNKKGLKELDKVVTRISVLSEDHRNTIMHLIKFYADEEKNSSKKI